MPYSLTHPLSLANDFFKEFYRFDRPFQEVQGYYITQNEDNNHIVCLNALGVDPADITVEVIEEEGYQYLNVNGKTHNELLSKDFLVDFSFRVRKPIKRIVKSFSFGLLTLNIEYDSPIRPKVEIIEG